MLTMPDFEAAAAHPAPVDLRLHPRDAAAAPPARARLRRGRALRDQVPRRARRPDRRGRDRRDPATPRPPVQTRRLTASPPRRTPRGSASAALETTRGAPQSHDATAQRPRRAARGPCGRNDGALPGLRIPDLLRRRRGAAARRVETATAHNRERDESRRHPHEARVAPPLGGRALPGRACSASRSASRMRKRSGADLEQALARA